MRPDFGIAESQFVQVTQVSHAPRMQTMTAPITTYHKILLGEKTEIQYHLSGYGVYREEALIRLLGEAIERMHSSWPTAVKESF